MYDIVMMKPISASCRDEQHNGLYQQGFEAESTAGISNIAPDHK